MQADKKRMTGLFTALSQMDSVSFHERQVADRLKRELQDLGMEVYEDDSHLQYGSEAGNLYACLKGSPDFEPVLFSAHMDTVSPGYGKKPRADAQGRITSDGTTVLGADDLCGVTEILEGIRLVQMNQKEHGDIEVLFTFAEEEYAVGAKAFDCDRIRSRNCYVLDMSGAPGSAARMAPTIITFEINVTGKAAHAGFAPEKGVNALAAAAKTVAELKLGRLSDKTTLNIGKMEAGAADNIVPEHCRLTGEVRSLDHGEALRVLAQVRKTAEEAAADAGAGMTMTDTIHLQAYETDEKAPVCRCFVRVCRGLGLEGVLTYTCGGSDNNVFAQRGLSGIVLSCGMHRTHSTGEYTTADELAEGAQLVTSIIREHCLL